MPLPKPAFFQSDRLPRWRAALAGGWIWLRLKFRHNPGFMTAAAAGSVGLVLTAILLLNGVLALPGASKVEEPEVASDAVLGEPEEGTSNHLIGAVPSAAAGGARKDRAPEASAVVRRSHEVYGDIIISNDDEPVVPPLGSLAANGGNLPSRFDRTPSDEDPFEANSPKAQSAPADRDEPLLVATEPPAFAEGASQPVELPESVEETLLVEEDEPAPKESFAGQVAEPANEPEADIPLSSPADDKPLIANTDQPPAEEEFDQPAPRAEPSFREETRQEIDFERELPAINERRPAAGITGEPPKPPRARETALEDEEQFIEPQTEPSWKYSTSNPPAARKESPRKESAGGSAPAPAAQSRAVETAVYATPETAASEKATPDAPTTAPKASERTAVEERAAPARLSLEIRAPKNVSPGQMVELEFVVTNHGSAPVTGANLSVALPAGLSHPLGPELEQPIKPLAACQSFRTRLTVRATAPGDASPRADLSLGGKITTKTTATLRVAPPGESRSLDPCACGAIRPIW